MIWVYAVVCKLILYDYILRVVCDEAYSFVG